MLNKIPTILENDVYCRTIDNHSILESRVDTLGIYLMFDTCTNIKTKEDESVVINFKDFEVLNKNDLLYFSTLNSNMILAKNNVISTCFNVNIVKKHISKFMKREKIVDINLSSLYTFIKTSKTLYSNNKSMESIITIINGHMYFIASTNYMMNLLDNTINSDKLLSVRLTEDKMKLIDVYISFFKETDINVELYEYNYNAYCLSLSHVCDKNVDSMLEVLLENKTEDIENIKSRKIDNVERYNTIKVAYSFEIKNKDYAKAISTINSFINSRLTVALQAKMIFEDGLVKILQSDRSSRKIEAIIGKTQNRNKSFAINDMVINVISSAVNANKKETTNVTIREILNNMFLLQIDSFYIAFESDI